MRPGGRSGRGKRPNGTPDEHVESLAPGRGDGQCPFQEAIDLLSKRHAMTIVWLLQQQEPRRFNEIKRSLDLNPVTLTQRLNELEEGGVLSRKVYDVAPPRVEYRLTQKGKDLVPLMDQLSEWAEKYAHVAASA